ncbi:MAG: FlgD immunoglobulin-like domain containing protein [Bacteroidales bacterium]
MKINKSIRLIGLAVLMTTLSFQGFSQAFPTGGYQGGTYGKGGVDGTQGTEKPVIQVEMALQAFPNPFAGETTIRVTLDKESRLELSLYSLDGRKVRILIPTGTFPPGDHSFTWNGSDEQGNRLANGLYLLRLDANRQVLTKKIALISY